MQQLQRREERDHPEPHPHHRAGFGLEYAPASR